MKDLHFCWLEVAIFAPLLGAFVIARLRDANQARWWSVIVASLTFAAALGAWEDFGLLHSKEADDRFHMLSGLFGREVLIIDQLSAPLLPLVALQFLLTMVTTLRTKVRRFSFAWTLFSESVILATLSTKDPWIIVSLLLIGLFPPLIELYRRGKPLGVYLAHMTTFAVLLLVGWWGVEQEGLAAGRVHSLWAIVPLFVALAIRSGIAPFHCWVSDLFEHATFATALLFVTPIVGAYGAVRLLVPIAPDWVLRAIGLLALATTLYAAGMGVVQKDARRFYSYLFLSHSALVLVGLDTVDTLGLTGALCVWVSVGLALTGFGLTLRALEARIGRLSLAKYHGLYDHTPNLAMFFGLTGLASIGFPGTFGFVGTELLVDGAVEQYPYVGVALVIAGALNGIAVVKAYFRLFTGTRHVSFVSLKIRRRERFAVLALAALILIGGVFPQPFIQSRYFAARELLRERGTIPGDMEKHEPELDEEPAVSPPPK